MCIRDSDTTERRERGDRRHRREKREVIQPKRELQRRTNTSYTNGSRDTVSAYTVPEGILDLPQIPATA